jgi:hypothetical protein
VTRVVLRRFRDHDEAQLALWTASNDPQLWNRIAANWKRAMALLPETGVRPRAGLRRFRTWGAADEERAEWERRRVEARAKGIRVGAR